MAALAFQTEKHTLKLTHSHHDGRHLEQTECSVCIHGENIQIIRSISSFDSRGSGEGAIAW